MSLVDSAETYITMRRRLGFKLEQSGEKIREFVEYAEERGDVYLATARIHEWATRDASPNFARVKLRMLRPLAIWLHSENELHEVPPSDLLGQSRRVRNLPPLLSDRQIQEILQLSLRSGPRNSISPRTYYAIFGLMASTGIRRFEATSLRLNDFSRDGLLIWNSKFNKSRLVPLHSSVNREMKKYLRYRLRENTEDKHFFILSTGMALSANALSHTFRLLCKKIEPWNGANRIVPTLNSLRHRFIIRSLEMAIKTDRKSVGHHMAALRAYVGHEKISHTYWYLRGTPELFQRISDASEAAFDRRTNQ